MPAPFHNRARNVWGWSIDELALILLRQFRRLLDDRGAPLTDAQMRETAGRIAARALDETDGAVVAALRQIVAESIAVLAGFGLTFEQSLNTEMTELAGWDTTADFLGLANEKINAELRISAGSALLALLGDASRGGHALISARRGENDTDDVDAVIAVRALAFAAQIDARDADRWPRIEAWLARRPD